MPVSLQTFSTVASQSTKSDQQVFVDGHTLQTKSAFSFFSKTARKNENIRTVQTFLQALRSNPTYANHLSSVTDITDSLIATGKPLTARHIKDVMRTLASSAQTLFVKNEAVLDILGNNNVLTSKQLKILRDFAFDKKIDLSTIEDKETFLKDFLKEQFAKDYLDKACVGKRLEPRKAIVSEFILQSQAFNRMIDAKVLHPLPSWADVPSQLSATIGDILDTYVAIFENAGKSERFLFESTRREHAFETTLTALEKDLISNSEIEAFLGDLDMLTKADTKAINTVEAKHNAICDYLVNTYFTSSMAKALSEHGLPESLAEALAHNPELVAKLKPHARALDLNDADIQAKCEEIFDRMALEIIGERAEDLSEILAFCEEKPLNFPFDVKDLPLYINPILNGKAAAEVIMGERDVTDPMEVADIFVSLKNAVASSEYLISGDFNAEQEQKVLANALKFLLLSGSELPSVHLLGVTHEALTSFAGGLSPYKNFSKELTFEQTQNLANAFISLHSVANFFVDTLRAEGMSDSSITVGKKDLTALMLDFAMPNRIPRDVSKLLGAVATELGQIVSAENLELITDISSQYVVTSTENYFQAPSQKFLDFIEKNKEKLGLASLTAADLAKISTSEYSLGVKNAIQERIQRAREDMLANAGVTQVKPNVRLSEAEIVEAIEESLTEQLTSLGNTIKAIQENGKIQAENKPVLIELALRSEIRNTEFFEKFALRITDLTSRLSSVTRNPFAIEHKFSSQLRQLSEFISSASASSGLSLNTTLPSILRVLVDNSNMSATQIEALATLMSGENVLQFVDTINYSSYQLALNSDNASAAQKKSIDTAIAKLSALNLFLDVLKSVSLEKAQEIAGKPTGSTPLSILEFSMRPVQTNARLFDSRHIAALGTVLIRTTEKPIFSDLGKVLTTFFNSTSQEDLDILFAFEQRFLVSSSKTAHPFVSIERFMRTYQNELLALYHENPNPTPAQVYTAIMGQKAPKNINEDNMSAIIVRDHHNAIVPLFRELMPDKNIQSIQEHWKSTISLGISHKTLIDFHQGKIRMTLENLTSKPGLSSLDNYTPENAYGLVTDFRRRPAPSSYTFEPLDQTSSRIGVHDIPDRENTPAHPTFAYIMATVERMTQSEKQKAVVLQSLTQAATINFTLLAPALGTSASEHGVYDTQIKQLDTGDVSVTVSMHPSNGYVGKLELLIKPNGDSEAIDFDFGREQQ